jgi:hypothetical protein
MLPRRKTSLPNSRSAKLNRWKRSCQSKSRPWTRTNLPSSHASNRCLRWGSELITTLCHSSICRARQASASERVVFLEKTKTLPDISKRVMTFTQSLQTRLEARTSATPEEDDIMLEKATRQFSWIDTQSKWKKSKTRKRFRCRRVPVAE